MHYFISVLAGRHPDDQLGCFQKAGVVFVQVNHNAVADRCQPVLDVFDAVEYFAGCGQVAQLADVVIELLQKPEQYEVHRLKVNVRVCGIKVVQPLVFYNKGIALRFFCHS